MRAIGWLLVVLGLIGFASEIDKALGPNWEHPFFGITLAAIFVASGVGLLRSSRGQSRHSYRLALGPAGEELSPTTLVLRTALKHRGRITAAEVAADTPLPYDDANMELERLARAGACRVLVGEGGMIVYHFPEFEDERAKLEAD